MPVPRSLPALLNPLGSVQAAGHDRRSENEAAEHGHEHVYGGLSESARRIAGTGLAVTVPVQVENKMVQVKIGDTLVGDGCPSYIVGEIGINHNGDLGIARRLIDVASVAEADAVKFQKRTVEVVYSAEELAKPRENPFGTTNGDLKRGLEFGQDAYQHIDRYCREKKVAWFASCWDEASVDFMEQFNPPAYKIASASLTDDHLLRHHRATKRPMIVSVGMSTLAQVDHAVLCARDPGSDHLAYDQRLPRENRGPQFAHDPRAARALRGARRLLGTRSGAGYQLRRGGPGRRDDRAAHHPRSRHVGFGPSRQCRAASA